jgi:hypothetical protein
MEAVVRRIIIITVAFLFFSLWMGTSGVAQTRHLAKKITLNLSSVPLDQALMAIEKEGNFSFSYNADLLNSKKIVSVHAENTNVDKILKDLLGKQFGNKEVGNHVILVRNKPDPGDEKDRKEEYTISGVIYDAATRKRLPDATVYEVEKKNSALSSATGSYAVNIPGGKAIRGLCYCKAGFIDTIIFVKPSVNQKIDVLLQPKEKELTHLALISGPVREFGIDSMAFVNWIVPRVIRVNSANLEVKTKRTFQGSVIPFVGSNWKVSGSITNRISFNLLAGYSGGVDGFELGGLLNMDRNDVRGFQIGGLGNIVGGNAKGMQLGGLFNFNLGKLKGFQLGGLANYVADTITGLQLGGLCNVMTSKIRGAQIGGLVNVVTNNLDGWQVAGLVNVAVNRNRGVQIAGLLNYAGTVSGLQLAVFNVAKRVDSGVPIGVFSYVHKGYHLFEISGNEVFYGNIAFKTGVRAFYNIISAGIGGDYKLNISYGIGTIFTLKKKLSMNIDGLAGFVYHPTGVNYRGLLCKFSPSLEYRFAKHFAMFLGPVYNCYVFPKDEPNATARGLSSYDFYYSSTPNTTIQMWIGGVFGFRF